MHVIAHKAPSDNRHARLPAEVAHQFQKLPRFSSPSKMSFLPVPRHNMVKAGNRSPNALHGAPFAGICLPSNTARLKRAIKTFTPKQYTRAAKGSKQAASGTVEQVNPCNAYEKLTKSLPKTDPLYGSARPQNRVKPFQLESSAHLATKTEPFAEYSVHFAVL